MGEGETEEQTGKEIAAKTWIQIYTTYAGGLFCYKDCMFLSISSGVVTSLPFPNESPMWNRLFVMVLLIVPDGDMTQLANVSQCCLLVFTIAHVTLTSREKLHIWEKHRSYDKVKDWTCPKSSKSNFYIRHWFLQGYAKMSPNLHNYSLNQSFSAEKT